jgi:hypothetical protein
MREIVITAYTAPQFFLWFSELGSPLFLFGGILLDLKSL